MCNLLKSSELSDTSILLRPSENSPFYATPSLQLYYGLRFALKGVLTSFLSRHPDVNIFRFFSTPSCPRGSYTL